MLFGWILGSCASVVSSVPNLAHLNCMWNYSWGGNLPNLDRTGSLKWDWYQSDPTSRIEFHQGVKSGIRCLVYSCHVWCMKLRMPLQIQWDDLYKPWPLLGLSIGDGPWQIPHQQGCSSPATVIWIHLDSMKYIVLNHLPWFDHHFRMASLPREISPRSLLWSQLWRGQAADRRWAAPARTQGGAPVGSWDGKSWHQQQLWLGIVYTTHDNWQWP